MRAVTPTSVYLVNVMLQGEFAECRLTGPLGCAKRRLLFEVSVQARRAPDDEAAGHSRTSVAKRVDQSRDTVMSDPGPSGTISSPIKNSNSPSSP